MTNKTKTVGPLGAALAGAALGAAAVFLADEKNRTKLKKTIDSARKNGEEKLNKLGEKVDKIEEKGRKKLAKGLEQTKDKVERK